MFDYFKYTNLHHLIAQYFKFCFGRIEYSENGMFEANNKKIQIIGTISRLFIYGILIFDIYSKKVFMPISCLLVSFFLFGLNIFNFASQYIRYVLRIYDKKVSQMTVDDIKMKVDDEDE